VLAIIHSQPLASIGTITDRKNPMKTKIITALAAVSLVALLLNPPWRIVTKDPSGHERSVELAWSPLFDPPKGNNTSWPVRAQIAADILAVELLTLAGITAGTWLLFRTKT
jgi:hypothetical protein